MGKKERGRRKTKRGGEEGNRAREMLHGREIFSLLSSFFSSIPLFSMNSLDINTYIYY